MRFFIFFGKISRKQKSKKQFWKNKLHAFLLFWKLDNKALIESVPGWKTEKMDLLPALPLCYLAPQAETRKQQRGLFFSYLQHLFCRHVSYHAALNLSPPLHSTATACICSLALLPVFLHKPPLSSPCLQLHMVLEYSPSIHPSDLPKIQI